MHDGGAPEWREIVEAHQARLIEELARSIESGRDRAVERTVAAEREAASRQLKIERESAKKEIEAERESAKKEIDAERESAKKEIEAERENAQETIRAERAGFKRQIETEREAARLEIEVLRESAKRDVEAERERARIEIEKIRGASESEIGQSREIMKREIESAQLGLERAREERTAALEEARSEHAGSLSRSVAAARQSSAEALNQSLRRMRQANSIKSVLELLADLAAAHAQKTVVLVFENNQARAAALHGVAADLRTAANGSGVTPAGIPLDGAPALASVIETRDPVTVLARAAEVSSALVHLLSAEPADKLYLFPLTARHHVMAMLVATGEVFPAAVELLAEAAGMRLEALTASAAPDPGTENLVQLQKAGVPVAAASDRRAWEDLSVEDQQLHLQAQRVARVRVAKMRLDREDAWRRGLAESDVYGALRRDIESARTEFLQTFLSKSPTMVDYLHLEILRSLAHDDDRVLGREYPGPMV